MYFLFFLHILLHASPLTISLEQPISPERAESYHEKFVTVRGFLYQQDANNVILSHQPNLKSCCVGSTTLSDRQLIINEPISFSNSLTVNTLQGIFYVDQQNASEKRFMLKNVEIVPQPKKYFIFIFGTLLLIFCICGYKFFRNV